MKSITAKLDTPLVEDKLLLRTVVRKKTRDGYTEILNHSGKANDRDDLVAGRLTLQYLPSDNLELLFHAAAVNDDGDTSAQKQIIDPAGACLLYTSPSPRDRTRSRMPSSA